MKGAFKLRSVYYWREDRIRARILIHSLEGCVWQGSLPWLRSSEWAGPGKVA